MVYNSKENGSLWVLPGGPFSKAQYLPAYDLTDFSVSNGSSELVAGGLGVLTSAVEMTTLSLGTYIKEVADWLERATCPFALYLFLTCEDKSVFSGWERGYILDVRNVADITREDILHISEDTPALHSFDLEAMPFTLLICRLKESTVFSVETSGNQTFLKDKKCCTEGYVGVVLADEDRVLMSPTLSKSPDWTPVTGPFVAANFVSLVKISRKTHRILVGDSSTSSIGYSDDKGATWSYATVTTTGLPGITRIDATNPFGILAITKSGEIYKSQDFGETWYFVGSDAIQTVMVDPSNGYAVSSSGTLQTTRDGGDTWNLGETVPTIGTVLSMYAFSRAYLLITDSEGRLWRTRDAGVTWDSVKMPAVGVAQDWYTKYYGIVGMGADGIYMTIDGGYTWELVSKTPSWDVTVLDTTNVYSLGSTEFLQYNCGGYT